ncbi:MAG: SDR family oxidoreductase [Rhodospirillaceae bacterium]|nr:SDR family oxidoreductase [Rhodospirillaceae bacterium]
MTQATALVTQVRHFVGLAAARALAADGVAVACQDASFADAAARAGFEAEYPGLTALAAQGAAAMVAEAVDRLGGLSIVVGNEAFPAIRSPLGDTRLEDVRAACEALVVDAVALVQAALPSLQKATVPAAIVLVTSAAPLRGLANYAPYVAARAAQNGLVTSWARELARDGIRVNAVAPNYVESPTYFPPDLLADPAAVAKMTGGVTLRRLGKPDEVGAAIAFLASPAASFITGHVMPVAGGWP